LREHIVHLALTDIELDPILDRYNVAGAAEGSPAHAAAKAALGGEPDDRLRESLQAVGMREPLLVKKSGSKWVLIDGYRRLYQIRYLAEKGGLGPFIDASALPCYVQANSDAAVTTLRLETNERRQSLPPSLQAAKFRELMDDHGRTIAQIAAMCGLSVPSVANYLVINKTIREVKEAIDRGDLPMSAGKVFYILSEEGQLRLWKKVAGAKGVTRRRLWSLADDLPERLYSRPKQERMDRSEHIRRAKQGQVQERGKTRTYLQGDLNSMVEEAEYKEQTLNDAREKLLRLVRWWMTSLRNPVFMDYMVNHHPDRLADIELVLEVEGGYRRPTP
jgi:ParB-like chromosome segregation protein Spo0J